MNFVAVFEFLILSATFVTGTPPVAKCIKGKCHMVFYWFGSAEPSLLCLSLDPQNATCASSGEGTNAGTPCTNSTGCADQHICLNHSDIREMPDAPDHSIWQRKPLGPYEFCRFEADCRSSVECKALLGSCEYSYSGYHQRICPAGKMDEYNGDIRYSVVCVSPGEMDKLGGLITARPKVRPVKPRKPPNSEEDLPYERTTTTSTTPTSVLATTWFPYVVTATSMLFLFIAVVLSLFYWLMRCHLKMGSLWNSRINVESAGTPALSAKPMAPPKLCQQCEHRIGSRREDLRMGCGPTKEVVSVETLFNEPKPEPHFRTKRYAKFDNAFLLAAEELCPDLKLDTKKLSLTSPNENAATLPHDSVASPPTILEIHSEDSPESRRKVVSTSIARKDGKLKLNEQHQLNRTPPMLQRSTSAPLAHSTVASQSKQWSAAGRASDSVLVSRPPSVTSGASPRSGQSMPLSPKSSKSDSSRCDTPTFLKSAFVVPPEATLFQPMEKSTDSPGVVKELEMFIGPEGKSRVVKSPDGERTRSSQPRASSLPRPMSVPLDRCRSLSKESRDSRFLMKVFSSGKLKHSLALADRPRTAPAPRIAGRKSSLESRSDKESGARKSSIGGVLPLSSSLSSELAALVKEAAVQFVKELSIAIPKQLAVAGRSSTESLSFRDLEAGPNQQRIASSQNGTLRYGTEPEMSESADGPLDILVHRKQHPLRSAHLRELEMSERQTKSLPNTPERKKSPKSSLNGRTSNDELHCSRLKSVVFDDVVETSAQSPTAFDIDHQQETLSSDDGENESDTIILPSWSFAEEVATALEQQLIEPRQISKKSHGNFVQLDSSKGVCELRVDGPSEILVQAEQQWLVPDQTRGKSKKVERKSKSLLDTSMFKALPESGREGRNSESQQPLSPELHKAKLVSEVTESATVVAAQSPRPKTTDFEQRLDQSLLPSSSEDRDPVSEFGTDRDQEMRRLSIDKVVISITDKKGGQRHVVSSLSFPTNKGCKDLQNRKSGASEESSASTLYSTEEMVGRMLPEDFDKRADTPIMRKWSSEKHDYPDQDRLRATDRPTLDRPNTSSFTVDSPSIDSNDKVRALAAEMDTGALGETRKKLPRPISRSGILVRPERCKDTPSPMDAAESPTVGPGLEKEGSREAGKLRPHDGDHREERPERSPGAPMSGYDQNFGKGKTPTVKERTSDSTVLGSSSNLYSGSELRQFRYSKGNRGTLLREERPPRDAMFDPKQRKTPTPRQAEIREGRQRQGITASPTRGGDMNGKQAEQRAQCVSSEHGAPRLSGRRLRLFRGAASRTPPGGMIMKSSGSRDGADDEIK